MQFELVPMLQEQRRLYDTPRGMERFRQYLALMTADSTDIALPLPGMNPMGKEHVPLLYDTLLDLNAEAVAQTALDEATPRLAVVPGHFRVGLVVSDDAQGGWTNRFSSEFTQHFADTALLKRGWIVPTFWTGDAVTAAAVRAEVLQATFRTAYVVRHGWPTTLGEMLAQAGLEQRFAGATPSVIAPDELDYIAAVIDPYRSTTDFPTIFACLYGDAAAASFGYQPLGLAPRAGLSLAGYEAQRRSAPPESTVA